MDQSYDLRPVDYVPAFDEPVNPMGDPNPYDNATLAQGKSEKMGKVMDYLATKSVPARIGQSAWSGFTYPGDALAGRVDPLSDEGIGRAWDLASVAAGISSPFAERGAAGIFGGRLAATADETALLQARRLAEAGAPRDEIWKQTGWYRGADDQWRFEVPDEAARLTTANLPPAKTVFGVPQIETDVGTVLQHPDLYKAYPELRDVHVVDNPEHGNDAQFIAGFGDEPASVHLNLSSPEARNRMLHEIQHWVQEKEGFSPGTNPGSGAFGATAVSERPAVAAAQDEYQTAVASRQEWLEAAGVKFKNGRVDRDAPGNWQLYQNVKDVFDAKIQALKRAEDAARFKEYESAAGEVEARNVERRSDFGPNARQNTPPWESQDTADALQWHASPSGNLEFSTGGRIPEKSSKLSVHYRLGTQQKHCGICRMFRAPATCTAVRGIIAKPKLCDLFQPKN